MSLTDCKTTHNISESLLAQDNQPVFHLAITDLACSRIPHGSSMLVPMVGQGQSVVQLLTDLRCLETKIKKLQKTKMLFRDADSLTWSSFTILHDDSLSNSLANIIHEKLSHNAVVATVSVPRRADIGGLLRKVPGKNFLVIIRKNLVEQFIRAVSL